jgi:cell division septation protein DedD
MKVICPKCQFENQADPNASRVVCARCATIVDVGMGLDEGIGGGFNSFQPGQGGGSGNYGNAGNNFGANYSGGYEQTIRPGAYPPASPSRPQLPEGDVYATRIDDDFDDVLDIPRPSAPVQSYQYNDNSPAFDDVFSTPSSYETMVDARVPDAFQPNQFQGQYQGNAYQENDYGNAAAYDQPNYGAPQQDAEFMGWPVLPEDTTDPGIPPSSAFSKKSGLLKVALGVVAIGALLIALYSYFGGTTKKTTQPKSSTAVVVEDPAGSETNVVANNSSGEAKPPAGPAGQSLPVGQTATQPAKPVTIPPVTTPAQPAANAKPSATVLVPKETKVTPPPVETAKATTAVPNKGNITIQAGSYNDQAQANERLSRLKASGVDARIVAATIPGRGTWYRVQIGRFPSREQAASFASQLRSKGAVQEVLVTPVN